MSDLRGQLRFMPARDLFRYLGNRRLSGTLTAWRGKLEKRLVVHDGAAISAASTDPREYLGQILINAGQLTEEDFNRAYQTQLETHVPLGQILSMIGLVPQEAVERALAVKIRETALDLCHWVEGEFAIEAHEPLVEAGVVARLPLLELCQEADARARAWIAMREVFPDGGTRLQLDPDRPPPVSPPGSMDERLFSFLAEGRSIDELLLDLHATEYQLYHRLYGLLQEGAIRVAERGRVAGNSADEWFPADAPAAPKGEAATPADHLERARRALARGALDEAVDEAGCAVDKGGQEPALELLRVAEGQLLAALRAELLAEKRVPLVLVERARVKAMPLTPPERYLLARMDGKRELGALVRVSPLRELDALRLVRKFARDGMIRFS